MEKEEFKKIMLNLKLNLHYAEMALRRDEDNPELLKQVSILKKEMESTKRTYMREKIKENIEEGRKL